MASHLTEKLHGSSQDETRQLQNSLSTTMYRCAETAKQEPQIPDAQLFAPAYFSSLEGRPPTVGECAAHLELLEAFFHLRLKILKSSELDKAFGLLQEHKVVYKSYSLHSKRRPVRLRDPCWDAKRMKKWLVFLSIAVARFQMWALKANEHIPPIDILMVWHAFLLNPRSFKQYCKELNLTKLRHLPFPWKRIHEAINSRVWTFDYTLPFEASTWFNSTFNLETDLFGALAKTSKLPSESPLPCALLHYTSRVAKQATVGTTDAFPAPDILTTNHASSPRFDNNLSLESFIRNIPDPAIPSPLVANVQRQSLFVDKMHRQLWIRSPSIQGTLSRAISRYENFVSLFSLYPGTTLVPTLDIDLVWHTHQLSAERYEKDMTEMTGRLINHDDTLQKETLGNGKESTVGIWRVRFGDEYEGCQCWDCEALKDELEGEGEDIESVVERVGKKVEYYRAVEIARRKGWEKLPVRS